EAVALEAARAALVDVRRAEAEKAKLDYDRAATLLNTSSAGSKAEVDRTRTEVQAANARVRAAEAERDQATILKERASQAEADMTVLAPFDGVVVRKRTEVGEWVRPGDPVVDLLDLDQIDVWLDVPERWLGRLNDPKTELKIDVPATGDGFAVTGAAVVPLADALSRLFPVRVRMQNPTRRLKPGMRVSGFVPTGEKRPVLTVHKDAILRDDAGAFVYFAAGTTAAVARIEPLYATSRTRMAVRAQGLKPGSQVVTEGNERLFPGRPLSSPDLPAPAPPSPER
ncbi:MAG: efflux RND transporter periplasmic adaptor subunit, partial [Planctomycetota bacterium]